MNNFKYIAEEKILKDEKGRAIIKINEHGEIIIGRYVDMTDACKDFIVSTYCELTESEPDKVKAFLNYESDEGEFCS